MAEVIHSLWSPEIKPTILSPFAILEPQARALTQITHGILVGEVKVIRDEENNTTLLHLDMIVPALDGYRQRVLTASYLTDAIYPVRIEAECFQRKSPAQVLPVREPGKPENEASSDEELEDLVTKVLQSREVKAIAVSLIARANDILTQRQEQAERKGGS